VAGIGATFITWLALKEPTGLADPRAPRRFLQGLAVGGFALTVCCLAPLAVGVTSLSLTSGTPGHVLGRGLMQLFTLAPAGIGEELLLRGLGLQALRRGFGDVPAVAISSVVFGALHLFNPGATWVAALLVALVGAWFGAVTVRTGSVWMAMGLHVSWNFFEGFVFGQPVSGNTPGTSLFLAQGPSTAGFWSGGAFGPEAAGWTAVVLALALGVTVALPRRSAALT
jgi:membrane protease YdiL (CAAX protease family)